MLAVQATCDSQLVTKCPPLPGEEYPRSEDVQLLALPEQETMPNPCEGVPRLHNRWCRRGRPVG